MSVAKTVYEQRAVLADLQTFLTSKGWTNITYTNGNSVQNTVTNPQITVNINPGSPTALQLGKTAGQDLLYRRGLNINAYMETDERAKAMIDSIIEFVEFMCPSIVDENSAYQGYIRCMDEELIIGQSFSPIMSDPKLVRYRGAVTAPVEAFYPNG